MTSLCPICDNKNWSKDHTASRILSLPEKYIVYACITCSQRRLEPQLTDSELKKLYSGAYFNSKQITPTLLETIKSPSADYVSEVTKERYLKFNKTIKNIKNMHPHAKTLLDVGAATGDLVKIARDHGLQAEGIELSEFAIRKANDINSIKLECLALAEVKKYGFYDCIHLNHVFEHFNDPVEELGHIYRLLSNGGLLYVEIPYQFHVVEKLLFKVSKRQLEFTLHSLHHPYFYTPETISRLLNANGFNIVNISVFDAARYETITLQEKIKKVLWRILAYFSVGNYIEIYARRKS